MRTTIRAPAMYSMEITLRDVGGGGPTSVQEWPLNK